jgi:Uma2 family endonuclease
MTTAQKLMTAEEFADLPTPSDERLELVRGVVVMAPPPDTGHGRRARRVERPLEDFIFEHGFGLTTGEGGYRLRRNPDTVRAPDSAWIAFDRLPDGVLPDEGYVDGAPNLAVEVISPGNRELDMDEKIADWLAAGCDRVWVVRPRQRSVTVHRPNGDSHRYTAEDTLTSDDAAFPVAGFELKVAAIFE